MDKCNLGIITIAIAHRHYDAPARPHQVNAAAASPTCVEIVPCKAGRQIGGPGIQERLKPVWGSDSMQCRILL